MIAQLWQVIGVPALFGLLGTMGFGILFSVPRRTLFLTGVVGALGAALRSLAIHAGASTELATFLAALAVGLVGYGAAFVIQAPRSIYTIPGVLTMVPGVAAYETVVYLSAGRYSEAGVSAVRAALIAGAIAAGLTTARIITDFEPHSRRHRSD